MIKPMIKAIGIALALAATNMAVQPLVAQSSEAALMNEYSPAVSVPLAVAWRNLPAPMRSRIMMEYFEIIMQEAIRLNHAHQMEFRTKSREITEKNAEEWFDRLSDDKKRQIVKRFMSS